MKKWLIVFCALTMAFAASSALAAGDTLADMAEICWAAETLDEQLALLNELASRYAGELETGGWDVSLICYPVGDIPPSLIPDYDSAVSADTLPDALKGKKFVAVYDNVGRYSLLGDYYARLPEEMRAASLEEAGAVLCLRHYTTARSDYTGPASNRHYDVYAADLSGGGVWRIFSVTTIPPVSGYGALSGETRSMQDLWSGVRKAFFGTLTVSYPEGIATFRVTGDTCCIVGLEGGFTHYEIPAEVEGYPVTGIERIKNDTLESLTLPEGVVYIENAERYALWCKNLTSMNFPSTLRRIGTYADCHFPITALELNEGLEEIGDFTFCGGDSVTSLSLPSTLKSMGDGFLEYGAHVPAVIVPGSVTRLPRYFLMDTGWVIAAYVPASVTAFADENLLACSREKLRIFTPEGSPASVWAEARDYIWYPCESPEDMPEYGLGEEDGFTYAYLGEEAFLLTYAGGAEEAVIPETLGGRPVTVIHSCAFFRNGSVRSIRVPKTVYEIQSSAFAECTVLEALYIPAGVTRLGSSGLISYSQKKTCTLCAPEGSLVQAWAVENGCLWEPWEPDRAE